MPLRLYVMACGNVTHDKSVFNPQMPRGEKTTAPMPMALLMHPKGNVLIDTGCHPDAVLAPETCWAGLNKVFKVEVRPEDMVVPQLESLGLFPSDIQIVVNTHMHMDHAGGNQFFPRAHFVVHRRELETAQDPAMEGVGYFAKDWNHPLDYQPVDGETDLFGDGVVRLIPAPGHTPGTMVVAVTLPGSGSVVLANDAAILERHVVEDFLPKNTGNKEQAAEALKIVRRFRDAGATIVYGHDGEAWTRVRSCPAYYE